MPATRPTIFLHVGTMKSGTTYLQGLLWTNREALRDAGLLRPGLHQGDITYATRDVLHGSRMRDPAIVAATRGSWKQISSEMLSFEGRSIFSMEFLSFANRERAGEVVESLAGADIHVVLTVRDATGALPAQWQTMCRNGHTLRWPSFVAGARRVIDEGRSGGAASRAFRRTQHVPRMLDAWGAWVPPDRLHVVTVPRATSDERLLWRRFASVLDVDPDLAPLPPEDTNPSIGFASAELVRRLNLRLGNVGFFDYNTVKGPLSLGLGKRAFRERRAPMDLATYELGARWNGRVRDAILASGAHVVGDLEDLPDRVTEDRAAAAVPELRPAGRDELLPAAATARDTLLALVEEQGRRLSAQGLDASDAERLDTADRPTSSDHWRGSQRPVRAAVNELTHLAHVAMRLRRRLEA